MRLYRKCSKCGSHTGKNRKTKKFSEICSKCGSSMKGETWYIDYFINGVRKREAVGTNKKLAEEVLAKRRIQIKEHQFLDIKKDYKTRIDEIADDFLKYSKNNKKSYERDQISVNHLLKYLGTKRLSEITPNLIEQYRDYRLNEGNVKHSTVNREIACLKCIFNWAIKNQKATVNPMKQVRLFKEDNTRTRYLSKEEIEKLVEASTDRIKPIVIAALTTGMRRSELLNLKWYNVNREQNIILVKRTKSSKTREIPICSLLERTLKKCAEHSDGVYVFCNESRKPYKSITSLFQNIVKKSGIKDFHFHDLRHTAASYLVMLGIDLVTVKEILGHKTLNMTLRYSHLSPVHKREAIEILGTKIDTYLTPGKIEEENEEYCEFECISKY